MASHDQAQQAQQQVHGLMQKIQENAPSAQQVMKMMAAITVGGALLLLAGITLTGTVVTLVVATPVLIFFSPVLVPVGTVLLLTTMGFLSAGGFGIAALSSLSWIVNYIRGKHPPGADKVDYARQRIASKAKDVKDRAGGYMQKKGDQATQGLSEHTS